MRLGLLSTTLSCILLIGCNEPEEQGLSDLRACDMNPVCSAVELGQTTNDADAICTLEGLRDQARGLYHYQDCSCAEEGTNACCSEFVLVAGPGEPVQRQTLYIEWEDIDDTGMSTQEMLGDIEQCELRADAQQFFQDCLDTPDTMACLRPSQWVINCAASEHPNCF